MRNEYTVENPRDAFTSRKFTNKRKALQFARKECAHYTQWVGFTLFVWETSTGYSDCIAAYRMKACGVGKVQP